jgi:hypothetical protein
MPSGSRLPRSLKAAPDITASRIKPLFRPVGELIINWSVLDSQLIKIVAILYRTDIGKRLESELPREFSRRLRFLRKCVSKTPELAKFAEDIKRMLSTAKQMVVVRDALVHGAISKYDKADGRYHFVKLDIDKEDDIHIANTVRMTLDDIQAHVLVSQDLMSFAIKVTDYLAKIFA